MRGTILWQVVIGYVSRLVKCEPEGDPANIPQVVLSQCFIITTESKLGHGFSEKCECEFM